MRLQQYTKKVNRAVAEKELRESRRSLNVDVATANRFIAHAVNDLTAAQKAALKQVRPGALHLRLTHINLKLWCNRSQGINQAAVARHTLMCSWCQCSSDRPCCGAVGCRRASSRGPN